MAGKQHLALNSFHNGLNTKTNSRDIADDSLALCDNASVDDVGRVTMSGAPSTITTTSMPAMDTLEDGHSLFRFSSDFSSGISATSITQDTDYIIAWDDTLGKLYWLPNLNDAGASNAAWATVADVLDLSDSTDDWGAADEAKPIFYYVDGALRISDSNHSLKKANGNARTLNAPQWIGAIKRDLFPDSGAVIAASGWKREKQELEKPTTGTITSAEYVAIADASIHWNVKNLVPEDSVYNFVSLEQADGAGTTDVGSNDSFNNLYSTTKNLTYDQGDSETTMSPEHWQTSRRGNDGYGSSYYHVLGIAMHGENDDHSHKFTWTGQQAFNTSSPKTFGTGQSLYIAVRLPGEENRQYWLGTHTKAFSDSASLSLTIQDAYITFKENSGNDFIKFRIDHTQFTDSTTPPGNWHIIEFPYDEAYETDIGDTFAPQKMDIEMNLTWTRTGSIYGNDTSTSTPQPYTKYRDIPGFDLIQLSDMRVGDTNLIGVTTVGKQKFLMSYTYDDTQNESLLHDFGGGTSQEIIFSDSTSSYKIGIVASVDPAVYSAGNNRITGANLYMDDDGIPYRIAQLSYTKGLKGAWESEYPTSDRFAKTGSSTAEQYVSSTIKTDGLPLLESYEAMNGFSPNVTSNIAQYSTATVLNRRTYIGNIYQDGKQYGDKMIKTNANNFDVFPSEGKSIDVVKNDGDTIIKLESYADRILQFKKNVMYLINATRDAEFLEDTFYGKGLTHQSASTVADIGIAWANENGCFLYDGERVNDLTQGKILETEWQTHITNSTDVTYLPLKKKILVTGNTNGTDVYEYSFFTKSWTRSTDKFEASKSNFILDIDEEVKYFTTTTADNLRKWDDSSSPSNAVNILTKDFTFGNPASRKKCFKFYLTYKSSGVSNLKVYYGTNGQDLTLANAIGEEVSTSSKFAGTSTSCYGSDGLVTTSGVWEQAELTPSSSINNIYSVQLHFKSSNLVTNGTFDTNTTGWTAIRSTLSVNSQKLRIASDSSSGNAIGYFDFTAIVGAKYRLKADFISGTDQGAKVSVGKTDALSTGTYQGGTGTMTTDTSANFTFTAVATTQRIYLYQVEGDDADGDYHEWDNIVVSPEVPSDFEINDITIVYREKPMK